MELPLDIVDTFFVLVLVLLLGGKALEITEF